MLDDQRSELLRYLEADRSRIDSSAIKRAVRRFVIGNRSWHFANKSNVERSYRFRHENLHRMMETVRRNGLGPENHLRHISTEPPKATSLLGVDAGRPYPGECESFLTLSI